jgi:DNA polymerase, archaea type
MTAPAHSAPDTLLYGACPDERLVAVEHVPGTSGDSMALYMREGDRTVVRTEPFTPFLVVAEDAVADCSDAREIRSLDGPNPLNRLVLFDGWKAWTRARAALAKATGFTAGSPRAPYVSVNDPVHQFLLLTGRTLMKGMEFEDIKRMQVDIECLTTPGYAFCNPEREGDRIVAIGLGDQTGWTETLSGSEADEKALLERFVETVRARDPDVLEGHNIFNFDLRYIAVRAKRLGVRLALGRDGSEPARRASRFSVGERTVAYDRFDLVGRHIVDTYVLAQAYDVSHRNLGGLGLKEVAVHFGLAAPDRTYIDGDRITEAYRTDPDAVLRYVRDDVIETRAVADLLSRSAFDQVRLLPYAYQVVYVRGTATKIDALMLREYLRRGRALPLPDTGRAYAGGYTDLFREGIIRGVHHADVRSLYPSLMVTRTIGPARDEQGVFLAILERLRTVRLDAKARMAGATDDTERGRADALQTSLKVLINSFYGYLGFAQGRFSDFDAAEQVTAQGRELLRQMIGTLRALGADPVEIDTDGIYFVPPEGCLGRGRAAAQRLAAFRSAFAQSLPRGIEIDFDGAYEAMFSYKMKNYALLNAGGELIIKGAALKSRGLEPFQRAFMEDLLRVRLEGRDAESPRLKEQYATAIREGAWPIERLAKTETLQDSPAAYLAKRGTCGRARNAAYELALQSEREYRAGDRIAYYVTGDKKSVTVYDHARSVADWDPENRDENVAYYLAKLETLYKKFAPPVQNNGQGELALDAASERRS